jgi:photosystem II stability/assembly factor-like uncharacterized protein
MRIVCGRVAGLVIWIATTSWVVAGSAPAFAGAGTWSPIGPNSGEVALYVNPADPKRVWATPSVWLSLDGGQHWEERVLGLDPSGVVAFAPDPKAPDTAYVLQSRLFVTLDAGLHWSPITGPAGAGTLAGLVVDPFDSRTLYAESDHGLFRTRDQGATWSTISQGLPRGAASVSVLAADPRTSGLLFATVSARTGCGWAQSKDGGDHWTVHIALPSSTSPPTFCPSGLRSAAATNSPFLFPPSPPGVVFGVASGGVWRSNDGGTDFVELPSRGFPGASEWAIDPAQPNTLYAATPEGLLRSTSGGRVWSRTATLPAIPFGSVSVSGDGSKVFASGGDPCGLTCGPFVSTDHGANWTDRSQGLVSVPGVQGLWVDRLNPSRILLGIQGEGVVVSTDGGATWSGSTGVQAPPFYGLFGFQFDQAVGPGGFLFLNATFEGMAGLAGALYRSFDGGLTWLPWSTPVVPVAFQPAAAGRILGFGAAGLAYSDDSGATWTLATGEVNAPQSHPQGTVVFSPADTRTAYALGNVAGTSPGTYRFVMWRSVDAGASWTRAGTDVPATTLLLPDPNAVATVYGTGLHSDLWVSFDGGTSWSSRGTPLGLSGVFFQPTATVPTTLIGLGSDGGVFLSTDSGVTWNPANAGLGTRGVAAILPDPRDPFHLYLAASGLYDLTLPVSTGCSPTTTAVCLNSSRFRVEVTWKDFEGNTGSGQAISLTADTGYFWFFSSSNVELVVKVLDERSVNNAFWVFYGALSNVAYTITVTDTRTGRVRTYVNPLGHQASFADTNAFPGS